MSNHRQNTPVQGSSQGSEKKKKTKIDTPRVTSIHDVPLPILSLILHFACNVIQEPLKVNEYVTTCKKFKRVIQTIPSLCKNLAPRQIMLQGRLLTRHFWRFLQQHCETIEAIYLQSCVFGTDFLDVFYRKHSGLDIHFPVLTTLSVAHCNTPTKLKCKLSYDLLMAKWFNWIIGCTRQTITRVVYHGSPLFRHSELDNIEDIDKLAQGATLENGNQFVHVLGQSMADPTCKLFPEQFRRCEGRCGTILDTIKFRCSDDPDGHPHRAGSFYCGRSSFHTVSCPASQYNVTEHGCTCIPRRRIFCLADSDGWRLFDYNVKFIFGKRRLLCGNCRREPVMQLLKRLLK
jgi:hypothetical protein